jgi:hypothetical protein
VLGKPLCNKGNAGATTHDRKCGQTGRRYPVAFGQLVQGRDDAVQRQLNQILKFISGEADVGAVPRNLNDQLGRRVGREPLLGQPALLAKPSERFDRRGAGRIDVAGEVVQDLSQQRLVDEVTGKLVVPQGLVDGFE